MKYLLDTTVIIDLFRGNRNIADKLVQVGVDECCISDITVYELYAGAYRKKRKSGSKTQEEIDKEIKKLDGIIQKIPVLTITDSAKTAGRQKAYLTDNGDIIEDCDVLIGAAAIWNDLILVTSNEKHHGRLFGIQLENWRNA